jgi:UDP-2-acetamido-2-deoxy-ribo-hexuluronate aminotransferase
MRNSGAAHADRAGLADERDRAFEVLRVGEQGHAYGAQRARYDELLSGLEPAIRRVKVRPDRTSVFPQYSLFAADREGLERALKAEGIPTAIHYSKSLHQQPAYSAGWEGASFPVSERLAREVISLPLHPYLDAATQDRVVAVVRGTVRAV